MTARGDSKDFGRYLQTCRRAGGMSLADVSHQTKITLENLRLIENEQLDKLPAAVFVKGFIKSIAGAVGADSDAAMIRLENKLGVNMRYLGGRSGATAASWHWYHMVLVVVLFIAQIGATLCLANWMNSPQSMPSPSLAEVSEKHVSSDVALKSEPLLEAQNAPEPTQNASAQPDMAIKPQKTEPLATSPQKTEPLATSPSSGLELRVTAVEATWLKVVSDNKKAQEFLLKKNQDLTVTAEHGFNLVIGNASGIRLLLNDQPVQVSGRSGQVVALHLP